MRDKTCRHLLVPALILLLSVATTSAAQSNAPIIVTATRTPVSADDSLINTVVITREQIRQSQAPGIIELLRNQPGVEVAANGGPGQVVSIFLRGAESDNTLVLVDGVRINPATLGVASIQHLPIDMIERVEISMGPRSTLYGSAAIGGVIQIFTRDGEFGEAGWRFGSYDTQQLSASLHGKGSTMRYGIDLSGTRTDGYPARSGAQQDSGYDNQSVNLKLGTDLGNTGFDFKYLRTAGRTDYYDFQLAPVDQDYRNSIASLTATSEVSTRWISRLRLSYFDDDIEQNQSEDFLRTQRYELDWQNDLDLHPSHLLTAGLQAYREKANSLSYGSGYEDDTDNLDLYLQDQFESGPHRALAGLHYTDNSAFDGHATGELGYGYQLSPAISMIGTVATGYRAPSSTDRFGFGGNPDLDPESSRDIELTARYQPASPHRASLTLFDNRIWDLISYVDPDGFNGPLPGFNQNIDETRTRGLQFDYGVRIKRWQLDAGLLLQDPEDLATGRQLPRRAREKFTLNGRYQAADYNLGAELIYVGKRPDSLYSDIVLDAYTLVNLSATQTLARSIDVGLRLDNLTDEDYQLADGFNTAGRSIFFDIRYRASR